MSDAKLEPFRLTTKEKESLSNLSDSDIAEAALANRLRFPFDLGLVTAWTCPDTDDDRS